MRKRALERVGQTTKRKGKEEGTESAPTKRKSNERVRTGDAVEYLKERASVEIQLKEQEFATEGERTRKRVTEGKGEK